MLLSGDNKGVEITRSSTVITGESIRESDIVYCQQYLHYEARREFFWLFRYKWDRDQERPAQQEQSQSPSRFRMNTTSPGLLSMEERVT